MSCVNKSTTPIIIILPINAAQYFRYLCQQEEKHFPNIFLYNNNIMHNYHDLPLHSIILSTGSDSHSPFPVHVAVLGPMSTCPVGQLKLTDAPSNDGST